jgi:hypothetical protein
MRERVIRAQIKTGYSVSREEFHKKAQKKPEAEPPAFDKLYEII